jgi:hypothetical protein
MYTTDVALFRAMNGYLGKLVADLDDADLDAQPAPGMNTPRWILAHLAICNDYTAGFFGETNPLCPGDWHAAYGPDSRPNDPTAVKLHKDELLKQIAAGAERVARLASAGPAGRGGRPTQSVRVDPGRVPDRRRAHRPPVDHAYRRAPRPVVRLATGGREAGRLRFPAFRRFAIVPLPDAKTW